MKTIQSDKTSLLTFGMGRIADMMSTGTGNTMVLLFSAEMLFSVWRYRS